MNTRSPGRRSGYWGLTLAGWSARRDPHLPEESTRAVADEQPDRTATVGKAQILDDQNLLAVDRGAERRSQDLEPQAMPAADADVGALLVAAGKALARLVEVEPGIGDVLDGAIDARRRGRRLVQPPVGHAQIERFVAGEIARHVKGKPGKAAIVGRSPARQLGADRHLERAVGEVVVDDGDAGAIAAARPLQTVALLIVGQLDRQAVQPLPL